MMGNPWSYRGHTLEWSRIRLLTKWDDIEMEYNASGMRTRKGDTYYELDGNNIISETTNGNTIRYYYGNGGIVGFRYNGNRYYYEKNLQGDIIGIYDEDANKLCEYVYDAWGNCSIENDVSGVRIGEVNSFRYRGYYYDSDIGLYYLKSRYYDPQVARFINADSINYLGANGDICAYNLFAYCSDNPVMRSDSNGCFAWWLVVAVVVAAGVAVSGCVKKNKQPTSNVGAAKPYEKVYGSNDSNSPNCYAYAIGSSVNEQPGNTSGIYPKQWNDVYDVGKSVEADLRDKGYTVRVINGPNDKVYENEFKIALRVGTKPYAIDVYGNYYYDYHFMRQTSTGQWAEKHGIGGDSVLHKPGETPDTIQWTLCDLPYYDSDIIYYAVGT